MLSQSAWSRCPSQRRFDRRRRGLPLGLVRRRTRPTQPRRASRGLRLRGFAGIVRVSPQKHGRQSQGPPEDLIVGPHNRSAIGTLVERQTRSVKLIHLPTRESIALHAALSDALRDLPPLLRRSLTWEQRLST